MTKPKTTEQKAPGKSQVPSMLIIAGAVLTFIGFVFPGLLWAFRTPGDVEMVSLIFMTLVGTVGLALMVAGLVAAGVIRARRT
ncbi:MAG TPA: hypothetical protein V6C76_15880 [Drouetiella sp.]